MDQEPIVYQVRAISAKGNVRIVHAYYTEQDAQNAIKLMKKRTRLRYTYVPVPNQPNQYWGINFSTKPTTTK